MYIYIYGPDTAEARDTVGGRSGPDVAGGACGVERRGLGPSHYVYVLAL